MTESVSQNGLVMGRRRYALIMKTWHRMHSREWGRLPSAEDERSTRWVENETAERMELEMTTIIITL
jgi:hypothetical protein